MSKKAKVICEFLIYLAPDLPLFAQLVMVPIKDVPELAALIEPDAVEDTEWHWVLPLPAFYQEPDGTYGVINQSRAWHHLFVHQFPRDILGLLCRVPQKAYASMDVRIRGTNDPAADFWQQAFAILRYRHSLGSITGEEFVCEVYRNPFLAHALLRSFPKRRGNHRMITEPEITAIGKPTVPSEKQIQAIKSEMGASKAMSDQGRWNQRAARVGAPDYQTMQMLLGQLGPKWVERFRECTEGKYDAASMWAAIRPRLRGYDG